MKSINYFKKLSIIIPFYNVEKYITECLNSILLQNKYGEFCEIICVNDCSIDNTKNIIVNFQRKFSNIRLVEHLENKKLGAARNTGLKFAKGEYVWFIDSDDYITENSISCILNLLENNDLDLLLFNAKRVDDSGVVSEYYAHFESNTGVLTGKDFLNDKSIPHWKKPVTAWSRIAKRSFMLENKFFYPEGSYFEDEVINLKQLFHCRRLMQIKDDIYVYRYNNSSITGSSYTVEKLYDKIYTFVDCLRVLDLWYNSEKELCMYLSQTHCSVLLKMKMQIFSLKKSERYILIDKFENIDFSPLWHYGNKIKFYFYSFPLILKFESKLFH